MGPKEIENIDQIITKKLKQKSGQTDKQTNTQTNMYVP
jgi:hypothetical protein